MFHWTGYGFLVPVIGFAGALCTQLIVDAVLGSGFYTQEAWPKLAWGFTTGITLWFVGNALNHGREEVVTDKRTGEEKLTTPRHAFLFLPVQYWSFVVILFGLVLALGSGS